MDLKKITALAMLVLMALPSMTMTVGADGDDGAGLAGAIERARIYLNKVRTSAENLAKEYPGNEMIQGYLNEIYDLLGRYDNENPEILFQMEILGEATAKLSEVVPHSGRYSVHLETTGTPGDGDEARIVIPMPEGFTLRDLETLAWSEFLVYGYPPHVDLILDMGKGATDALVFEYAYNYEGHAGETWPTYDALTDAWYQTFSDDGNGPSVITDKSRAWLSSGAPGPLTGADDFYYHNLGYWKSTGDQGIDGETRVLRLEIEVDNWITQTKAYVDDVMINGITYDLEEEEEEAGQIKYYLDQASASLDAGDINSSARNLAAARNILGRVNGLLTSMAKTHKVARTEKFMRQFEHRIEGLEDKIDRLRGRLGEGVNKAKAAMGRALGNIPHMGENPSDDDVSEVIDDLEITTASINTALGEQGGDTSTILEAIYRLEAKIRVLKASAERLERKGADTSGIEEELEGAEALLEDVVDLLEEGETDKAEGLLEDAEELVSGVSGEIRAIGNKGSKGNGKGKGR